jgi:hypothetical protein
MSRALLGRNQAQALLGAWQSIVGAGAPTPLVGWQTAGQPTNLHHGPYGGHRFRQQHAHFGGWGPPAWGPRHGGHWAQTPWGGFAYGQEMAPWDPNYDPEGMVGPAPVYYPESPYPYPPPAAVPYAIPPRNMLVDRPGPDRADRILLPMSSGVNILPNTSAQITSRPQNVAFRPERIIIGGNPGDWIVNDIKVGNRSQFSQSGDIPGETFASTAIDSFVSFETVQTAMDFVMLVTFIGASESGAPFVCSVLGTAAV